MLSTKHALKIAKLTKYLVVHRHTPMDEQVVEHMLALYQPAEYVVQEGRFSPWGWDFDSLEYEEPGFNLPSVEEILLLNHDILNLPSTAEEDAWELLVKLRLVPANFSETVACFFYQEKGSSWWNQVPRYVYVHYTARQIYQLIRLLAGEHSRMQAVLAHALMWYKRALDEWKFKAFEDTFDLLDDQPCDCCFNPGGCRHQEVQSYEAQRRERNQKVANNLSNRLDALLE